VKLQTLLCFMVLCVVCLGMVLWSQEPNANNPFLKMQQQILSDSQLLEAVRSHSDLFRVTDKPFRMTEKVHLPCNFTVGTPIETFPDRFGQSVHGDRYCDVFVSSEAKAPILDGKSVYPENSLIIKAKYPNAQREKIELFTVMRKMPPGYSTEQGDWEYSVIDAEAKHVLSRGKLDSCIECHEAYRNSDFVTRVYLMPPDR
jgi:hypothetical protein